MDNNMWKNILQYGGAGMSTVGSAMAMTGYGTIPGIILMGLGAGATAGSQFINTNNSVNQVPINISNSILTDPPKMANGGVIKSGYPYHYLSRMIAGETTNIYPDGNRMYSPKKELWQKAFNFNPANPTNPVILDNLTPSSIYGSSYNGNEVSLPNLPNNSFMWGSTKGSPSLPDEKNDSSFIKFLENIFGNKSSDKPTNKPTGTNYYAKYDKMVKDANVYNAIGAGIGIAGNALGLINEINAKKTEDVMAPSMSDTRLDKDQSTFVNFMLRSLETSRNAGYRNAVDMGADPIMTSMMLHSANNMGKLQVMAQAEQQRQQIAATEAQINAQKETTAAQLKANVDQFNIQKQINENESSSKNIIGSIIGMGAGLTSYGQAKLTNSLFADEMIMRMRKSMQQ